MIVNQTPYPINFEMKAAQALTCRYGEVGRQYKFITDIDLTGLSANLQVIKPDGTFVIEEASVVITEDEQYIIAEIPLQATVVKGVCRYDINVYKDEDIILYTAEGPLWVDDKLITEDLIESVAEVYGLRFPQDFLTVENLVDIVHYVEAEIIKDDVIAEDTTWSSQKIEQEISGATPDIDVSKEVTGNPIEFTDGADAPLIKCITEITGYQEGTGTPSPDNIRPIVAYTEGEIEVRGKNIFNPDTVTSEWGNNFLALGGTLSSNVPDGTITLKAGTYTLSNFPNKEIRRFDESGARVQTETGDMTFTLSKTEKVRFAIATENISFNIQLEENTTPTTYEPYKGTTHTTTYPSAIYRGSEDVVNGTVGANSDGEMWLVADLGDLTWHYDNDNHRFEANLDSNLKRMQVRTLPFVCSCYQAITDGRPLANVPDGSIYNGTNEIKIFVHDSRYSDAVAFKTAVTGQNVAYPLQTPTTSSVTPTNLPIHTLSGYNYIESSTGEMEVEYIRDTYQPLVDLIQSSSHVYSTAEQVVGKWINGKNLYKKTVVQTTGFSTSYTLNHGISGIDEIIDVYGMFTHTSGDYFYKINDNVPVSNYYTCVSDIGKSSVGVYIGGSRLASIGKLTLTFIYTKE